MSKSDAPNFADLEARKFADTLDEVIMEEHKIMLGNVKAQFPSLTDDVIKDAYSKILDPYLVLEILKITFKSQFKPQFVAK